MGSPHYIATSIKEAKVMSKEKVTKVRDGDTFETEKKVVRLEDVDTPEKGRPGSVKAKKALEDLILGKEVDIKPVARGPYRRTIAQVKKGRISVNKAMKKYEK